ncbi:hypothetical protein LX95_01310 [Mesonia algae]|uniref:Uncharacterized protein n=1 Tax=Mesonia algae TaxID=213248 RepID=A0A2W7I5X2_9FLAO|nr:hypothetical protein [Mesonia algae]PZW41629.1 hypothetical protein LX95_01310 [Mesonia algae]
MNSIGDDKKNHIIAFSIAYLALEPFLGFIAFLLVVFAAALVEFIDFIGEKGEPSVLDFLASIILPTIHIVLKYAIIYNSL